jgi:hypothetical protein
MLFFHQGIFQHGEQHVLAFELLSFGQAWLQSALSSAA